ncbi:hypothetical protein BH09PLA1_BH09PLA1_04810 [soil metagenome]
MSESIENKLRRIFDLVIDAPVTERAVLLSRECGEDIELRQRVEAMIAGAEHECFLNAPTVHDEFLSQAEILERPGARIGPYKLLQLIGEGGFGSVFLAEQVKPVARRVALKIIKLGMDTRQVVARFEQERQALALMDHSHIARVFDAGSTETGRPFFVMELCSGQPITDYCDKHNLSIANRLELFTQVCRAVQHAHQKGLIHRDIKPSNVLVSTQDSEPHAKIIDFGIAKATASKLTEKTLFTEHKHLIGTPEYMSPEQAEGSLDIDTRTDVYSLGVLLYELLTGSTPFDSKSLRSAAYAEIQRIIREVDPPKPSTRLQQSSDTIGNVASQRNVEPKKLGTIVRGELDWIVMKALEKGRNRRYESANALGSDIERYLSGEAVSAAPPSRSYVFRKFVSRHKGPVSAGTAVTLALVLGAIAFAWQAQRARRARDQAIASQQAELQARTRAEAINHFVIDALQSSDPYQGGSKEVTISQAMDRAAQQLDQGAFKADPLIEAGLRFTIGSIFTNNAKFEQSEAQLTRAIAIQEATLGPENPELARTLRELAMLYREQKKFAQGQPFAERSLAIRQKVLGPGHLETAESFDELGTLEFSKGDFVVAETNLAKALQIREKWPGAEPRKFTGTLNNLANTKRALAKYAEAEPLFQRAIAVAKQQLGPDDPDLAATVNNLAEFYRTLGRLAEAEPLFAQSLEIYQRALGPEHPKVSDSLNNLAAIYAATSRLDQAESHYLSALAIREKVFGSDSADVAQILNNIADVYRLTGRVKEAQAAYQKMLEIYERVYGANADSVALACANLAITHMDLKQFDQAEPLLLRALKIREQVFDPGHPNIARACYNLAEMYRMSGRFAQAEPFYVRAVSIRKAVTPTHPDNGLFLSGLALTRHHLNQIEESRHDFKEAVTQMRRAVPDGSANFAMVLWRAGMEYLDGKPTAPDQALPHLQESVSMAEKFLKPDHPKLIMYRKALERCQAAMGK